MLITGIAVIVCIFAWAALARNLAPTGNTARDRFDAIIVLGYPADSDGNPTPTQLERVTEAVREYERGVAPQLIMTGGAAANQTVEAQVMARTAEAQGVPASKVIVEPNALDTIQNACYSARIMKAHGWSSAEIVSSPSHLPRAAMIFSRLPIVWQTHAAPEQHSASAMDALTEGVEIVKTVRYLTWARWREQCEP